MVRLGVTGHLDLTPATVELVRAELRLLLAARLREGPLTGLSCLARGADSVFAEEVLAVGGRLVAVVPARDYRRTEVSADHAGTFDRLLAAAAEVVTLPFERSGREAYAAANSAVLARTDTLVAVWDGAPGCLGSSADMVGLAVSGGVEVLRIWPRGATRTSAAAADPPDRPGSAARPAG
jgi:hypothetical protein